MPLTAEVKGALVILVLNQYICTGCSPGNTPTFERWQLVQMTTVAIVCTTGIYTSLFSRLSGREGTKCKIGVARIECSNTHRKSTAKRTKPTANDRLLDFMAQLPLDQIVA